MISFWEKESYTKYDFIIIGGGIVGLSTAVSLKEKYRKASVLVLERGIFPSGASTKNAGFACFGSLTELLADIRTMGEAAALQLVQQRWEGLKKLRDRLGDRKIDYRNYGGYELLKKNELGCLHKLEYLNQLLQPVFQQPVFHLTPALITGFGFSPSHIKGLIHSPFEAQLDSGKLMKCLQKYAAQIGVEVLTGTEVARVEEGESKVDVTVESKYNQGEICFSASMVGICTNAFTKKLVPEMELVPGRGQVLVTAPIPKLKIKGVFHYDEGYFYFRNFGNRVILGGGRNQDFDTETSTDFNINKKILNTLVQQLEEVILPEQAFHIEQVWTGIMAFGPNKQPICRRYSPRIALGVRLGGMGVAIGSQIGRQLAELLTGDNI